jgi:predicted Zn-dependent peptidase
MTVPMPSLESATVTVWVKTGSRFEEKRISGISHFLEHMLFKGSKKRPSAKAISEVVDSFGGEQNAFTSKDWTSFYIKSSTESIEMAMDVLSDMVLRPIIDPKEIEREKGTIIQEIAMYEDTPTVDIQNVFESLTFDGNPVGWDVAGSAKTVSAIKRDDFMRYRKIHYYPENMLVCVAGGVDQKRAKSLVEKYFSDFSSKKVKTPEFNAFKVSQTKPQLKIKTKKIEQANIILGFLGNGRGYKNRYVQTVLSSILNGGMSSRLFIEVRERRGLAYAVQPVSDRYQDVGYLGAYAGTDPKKAEEAIKVMLDQFYGLASGKFPVDKKELSKAKEYIKGHIALSLESTNAVSGFFGEQELFLPRVLTPDEMFGIIDRVTIDDVIAEAKRLFIPSKLNLAIIGPYKDENKWKKLLF